MKVCISNRRKNISNPKSGKGYFVARLVKEFALIGIEVTTDPTCKVDIHLGIGKFEHDVKCKKRILRLGDVHKSVSENYKLLNKRKIKALHKADGVIYQSEYSQKLCDAFLGKAKCPTAVIFNGADPNEFQVEPMKSPYKYNFLASARVWTKQKRLRYIEEAFWLADVPSSCLWVCGDLREEWNRGDHNAITKLGIVNQQTLASLYRLCDAMIDITWLSACPNNIVESLVAGCPVICTAQSGTAELGRRDGSVYTLSDKSYDYKPVDLNKPPKIDIAKLARLIKMNADKNRLIFRAENIHISTVAQQYKNFFEKILND